MLDLLDEFRGLLSALDAEGVEYAVCGGLAVAIHLRPRATIDVDLLVPRDEVERAKDAIRSRGYAIEAGPMIHRLSKPDPESGDLMSVDLVIVTPALASVWETRERVGWEHGDVPVVSRSGRRTMARADMSAEAVTVRLVRTSQLRRLCLELRRTSSRRCGSPPATDETAELVPEAQERYRGAQERPAD